MDDVLVVVPAYNEAQAIGETLDGLLEVASRVVVVDDGSDDRTAAVAAERGVTVLRLATNLYYGGALQAGFRYALKTDAQVIVTFDADGQHDPAYIESLVEPVRQGRADYVIGSRFLQDGANVSMSVRQIGIKIFAVLASLVLKRRVTDPTSGFLAMNREVARVFTGPLFPQDYPDADILIMLDRMGFGLLEVPVNMRPSISGGSMHAGILRPLYYTIKMSISMINLATRGDLKKRREEAKIAV